MSARPNTTQADQAVGEQPMLERPMGRRTLLRAAIITVPMVAAFSRNAHAATDGHGCITPDNVWCPACSKCLKSTCTSCNNGVHSDCNKPECQQAAVGAIRSNIQGGSSLGSSPFQQGQSGITDGGFNSSPWQ